MLKTPLIKLGAGKFLNETGKKISDSKFGQLGKAAFAKGKFVGGKITNAGKFVGGKAKKFKEKADNIRDKVKEKGEAFSENHKGLMKGIKGAKTLGANTLRKSMPIALGMMGMAMSYSTGSSGVMEAIGVGSGLQRGSAEFLASSQGTIEGNVQENLNEDVENDERVQDIQEQIDENEENLAKTNENLKGTNDRIEGMTNAEKANGNDYLALLREEDKLKARQEALKAKEELEQAEKDELAAIEKRQAEIDESKKKLNKDPEIAKVLPTFEHKHQLEKQLAEQKAERTRLYSEAKKTRKDVAKEIIGSYRNNGEASQIARARSEITKAIQKCMMERKYKDSQGDVSAEYTLSDKETRSSERMQESICALLDRAVVAGGGSLDSGEVFKRYFGADDSSPMAQSLKQAIDAYQFQARAKNYNDNEDLYKNTGGTKEKFENDVSTKASKHG